jgi:cell wall-associated NlpC family hydrolase
MRTDYLARARALVGCRFRAQGRNPELGLDCVGLALTVYEIADAFRRDYRLRGDHQEELKAALSADFRRVPAPQQRPGDLLLCRRGG